MRKGIFWVLDSELLAFVAGADNEIPFNAKSGDTYNHKLTWDNLPKKITGGFSYNYYPRGRVEIRQNKAIIFLNPNIVDDAVISQVKKKFELTDAETEIKVDGSKHYESHIDRNGEK